MEHSRSFVKSSIRTVIVSRAYDPSDAISGLSMDNESSKLYEDKPHEDSVDRSIRHFNPRLKEMALFESPFSTHPQERSGDVANVVTRLYPWGRGPGPGDTPSSQ